MHVEEIQVEVIRRKVKHLRIQVLPPQGHVRAIAPQGLADETIHAFIRQKLPWIRKHRQAYEDKPPTGPQSYNDGDPIPILGKDYPLELVGTQGGACVDFDPDGKLVMHLKADDFEDREKKEALLYAFYRQILRDRVPALIAKWEPIMGVKVQDFAIRRMKTRWGSCNIQKAKININSELAKHPPDWLEYVVVHEMVHLLERYHNKRFYALMDYFLPGGAQIKHQMRI